VTNTLIGEFGEAPEIPGTTVSVFKPGSTTPDDTLTGVLGPGFLAFDNNDHLYVSNQGSTGPTFNTTASVFTIAYDANGRVLPKSSIPSRTLTGLNLPGAIAVDPENNVFIGNFDDTVSKFSPSAPAPSAGGVVISTAQPNASINV